MSKSVLEEFFAHEVDDRVRSELIEVIARGTGDRYLTYNTFNVRLDFDHERVTIEDELDVHRQCVISLHEFAAMLT